MKQRLALAVLALCAPCFAALTTVQDTLYTATGGYCSGTLTVSWETFTAPDGRLVYAGVTEVAIAPAVNGLTVTLEPGQYTASYNITPAGCVPAYEQWIVPVSSGTVNLAAVRSINPPVAYALVSPSWIAQDGAVNGQAMCWLATGQWGPGNCGSAAPSWGSITGSLSNQIDLNAALAAKVGTGQSNTFTATPQYITPQSGYYNVGYPAGMIVSMGAVGNLYGTPSNGIQVSMLPSSSWSGNATTAGLRVDYLVPASTNMTPVGLFEVVNSDTALGGGAYSIWATTANSAGNPVIGIYDEIRDFTSNGTASDNFAAMEINVNTHSAPSNSLSSWLGINFARQGSGAGAVEGGTALWIVGSGGAANWEQGIYYQQSHSDSIVLGMYNSLVTSPGGYFRLMNLNNGLSIRLNSAAAYDFSTYHSPILMDEFGDVYLGGAGGTGDAVSELIYANNAGAIDYGSRLVTGNLTVDGTCTGCGGGGGAGADLIDFNCLGQLGVGGCNFDLPSGTLVQTLPLIGSNVTLGYASFPGAATGSQAIVEFHRQMPHTWNTVTFDLSWFSSATSGAATWYLQLACVNATSGGLNPAGDSARSYSSTANSTAGNLTFLTTQTLTLPTACAAATPGPILVGWLYRNGSDTLGSSAAANLFDARLTIQ